MGHDPSLRFYQASVVGSAGAGLPAGWTNPRQCAPSPAARRFTSHIPLEDNDTSLPVSPRPTKNTITGDSHWVISTKGTPLQTGARWVVERTNSWHNRGFKKLHICTEKRIRVIDAFSALANTIIIVRRLIREGWMRYRWNARPSRQP